LDLGPIGAENLIAVLDAIRSARTTITYAQYDYEDSPIAREIVEVFTSPYFILDDRMTRALTEAPKRGVRVVLLLPGSIDNNLVRQKSRAKIGELFGAGIEIHEYWNTNLDNRSFALNEELNPIRDQI
jgi:phosphatidylserine/phosphatidylglycerophosphate/cardiolipin synthase-like enzyme